ncbi:hypothetical protein [Microbacterium kunmingense]|uniref:hypothetical protein n=1 Tax=Microbacterium kunmingense TaxID=2915939 RepID=UPI003D76350F
MTLRHPSRLRAAAAAILTAALIAGFTVPMAGAVERRTPAIAAGVAITWVGGYGGRWDVASNWSPAAVPTVQQIVGAVGSEIVIPSGVTAEAGRLVADSVVVIEGALALSGPSSVQTVHLADRYDRGVAPHLSIADGVALTEPTSTTGITGTDSRVELAGGANLWGVWTVDGSNEVNV